MPQVWNRNQPLIPKGAVYVGRPTKWGNPYEIGRDGTRREVVEKYRVWLLNGQHEGAPPKVKLAYQSLKELKGKHLVCWCAPQACHADVLLELANS